VFVDDQSGLSVAEARALLGQRADAAAACWWLDRIGHGPSIEMLAVRRQPDAIRLAYRVHNLKGYEPVLATMDLPLGPVTAEHLAEIVVCVVPDSDGGEVYTHRITPPGEVERAREWLTRFWLNLPHETTETTETTTEGETHERV